jgi:cardiolipin synthase (CMP-forming)
MRSKVFTIPNVISVVRLLLIPVFLWLLWKPDSQPVAAAVLLAFLGATDWIDGYIARHFDQGSELGKILDPTADRALLIAAAIALLTQDLSTPVNIMLWVVLGREVVIGAATVSLGLVGARRIDVVWAGKAGTLAIMFALPLFLAADAVDNGSFVLNFLGWCFAIGGIAMGYFAALKYVPAARAALREGRGDRDAVEVQQS